MRALYAGESADPEANANAPHTAQPGPPAAMSRAPQATSVTSMHQELSLWSHVTAARQPQLLRILSGIAGHAPEAFMQHHLVFRPARGKPMFGGSGGGAADLYYVQLIARVDDSGKVEANKGAEGERKYDPRAQRWTMRLEDQPEVTRKPVVSRHVYVAETGEGDAVRFMSPLGYVWVAPPSPPLISRCLSC